MREGKRVKLRSDFDSLHTLTSCRVGTVARLFLRQTPTAEGGRRNPGGIVLGPALIGRLPFVSGLMEATKHQVNILNFVYWLGLLLLMFLSGAETRQLFTREERREVG